MALSDDAVKRLMIATTSKAAGQEIANAINLGQAGGVQEAWSTAALIVATNVSQTIDFGALQVGDKVIMIPAVAGNSVFVTVATAGTLGIAAVVGNLYIVMRAFAAPAAVTNTF